MRPSSNWRKQIDDTTVDIFGNKKRGGGGDPVRRINGGSTVSNISKYKVLQQKVNPSAAITANTLSSVIEASNALQPHLKSSAHNNSENNSIKQLSNELFRLQLDEQIAQQREQKRLLKLKAIEEEKLSQQKLQKEMEHLRSKHMSEINNESSGNAGFLRYRNSHSHIPPNDNQIQIQNEQMVTNINQPILETQIQIPPPRHHVTNTNQPIVQTQSIDEVKQTENINIYNNANYNHNIEDNKRVGTNNMKSLEMELLEEKLAWKQKISEQELELRKLKLQMLQQQNDQKTTLQYLLKLQTDFTEQIYQTNKSTKINIKRPISGLQQPVSVQSSVISIPEINQYNPTNITRAPPTPKTPQSTQIPQTPQQTHQMLQQNHQEYHRYHQPSIPCKDVNNRLQRMIHPDNTSPIQYNQSNNITNQQYMKSSYFPIQSVASNNQINYNKQNNNYISHVPEERPLKPMYFNQTPQQISTRNSSQQVSTRNSSQQISTRNSSHRTSPITVKYPQRMEEEKQESFLVSKDVQELNTEEDQFGVLLSNHSSFVECSDEETNYQKEEDDQLCSSTQFEASSRPITAQPHNNTTQQLKASTQFQESSRPITAQPHNNTTQQLIASTQFQASSRPITALQTHDNMIPQLIGSTTFEISSRPATALPSNVVIDSKDKQKSLSPVRQSVISTNSYSSFRPNEEHQEDPFTIHVVDSNEQQNVYTESNDDWKQISDIDRDNVESLRDALQEIVSSPLRGSDDDISEPMEEEVPIPTPNTSMNRETFVVKYAESKENEDQYDNEEYEEDFDNESETLENKEKRDILRLPDLDASINNFESKIYSVYSSFDNESMLTTSVASSSDFGKSPQKMACLPISE